MSNSEQEMNMALDKLEIEQLDNQQSDINKIEQDQPTDSEDTELNQQSDTNEPAAKPPGFLSYDEWIDKGKDPADYRGENAYKSQYESLQEVRELKNAMGQVVDSMETWKQEQNDKMAIQVEQAKEDALIELEKAKEDEDMNAALAAQEKINKLEKQKKAQKPPQLNPVITDFATKNPIIDTTSTQYNAEFHQDMITIHNNKLDQLLGGDRSKAENLTGRQVERVQKWAFEQAKGLHQEKFVSPKNRRTTITAPKQRPTNTKGDISTRLKTITGNSKNSNDVNPANDIYEILKEKDPAAAETFAKNMLGD